MELAAAIDSKNIYRLPLHLQQQGKTLLGVRWWRRHDHMVCVRVCVCVAIEQIPAAQISFLF